MKKVIVVVKVIEDGDTIDACVATRICDKDSKFEKTVGLALFDVLSGVIYGDKSLDAVIDVIWERNCEDQ